MEGRHNKVSVLAIGFVVGIFSQHTLQAAPEWRPDFVMPNEQAVYKQTDPVRVRIPGLPNNARQRFSFEIDDNHRKAPYYMAFLPIQPSGTDPDVRY